MIFGHLWGFYTNPKQEWQAVKEQNTERIIGGLTHTLLIAILPSLFAFISSVFIGWNMGVDKHIFLTPMSALVIAMAMYVALVIGVLALAYITYWMSVTYGSSPTIAQAIELAVYTATPIFMASIAALYPQLWFLMLVGLASVAYSIYLLYIGVPILMQIPEERGFIYASSIVTAGSVLLVAIITSSVILWNYGFAPEFIY